MPLYKRVTLGEVDQFLDVAEGQRDDGIRPALVDGEPAGVRIT
jgi:hypothetical protein